MRTHVSLNDLALTVILFTLSQWAENFKLNIHDITACVRYNIDVRCRQHGVASFFFVFFFVTFLNINFTSLWLLLLFFSRSFFFFLNSKARSRSSTPCVRSFFSPLSSTYLNISARVLILNVLFFFYFRWVRLVASLEFICFHLIRTSSKRVCCCNFKTTNNPKQKTTIPI